MALASVSIRTSDEVVENRILFLRNTRYVINKQLVLARYDVVL